MNPDDAPARNLMAAIEEMEHCERRLPSCPRICPCMARCREAAADALVVVHLFKMRIARGELVRVSR